MNFTQSQLCPLYFLAEDMQSTLSVHLQMTRGSENLTVKHQRSLDWLYTSNLYYVQEHFKAELLQPAFIKQLPDIHIHQRSQGW